MSDLGGGSAQETLEAALREFQGSVIAVSHDRYFLKQIATRIIAVRGPPRPAARPRTVAQPTCGHDCAPAWPMIVNEISKSIGSGFASSSGDEL